MRHATSGASRPSGDLAIRVIGPDHTIRGPGLWWRLANLRHWWRGFWRKEVALAVAQITGLPVLFGELSARLMRADGTIIDYGVLSYRVVTTAYVTALATYQFDGSGAAPTAYDHHDMGTGTNAEASGDTALQTPYGGARTNGTPTNPGAGQYRNTGTIAGGGTFAITEHGLFSASSSGTLLDRSVFSAINIVSGDSIQFQYTLTYSAGG